MASRNNPLINWLNLSFDTFNLLHRWFGRIVVLEAVAHAVAYGVAAYQGGGWAAIQTSLLKGGMVTYGFIVSLLHHQHNEFTDITGCYRLCNHHTSS